MLELFVDGTKNSGTNIDTVGKIDLHGDEPLQLNISIIDITDISKRNSTFSQSFVIPATKNNNILLTHIFNIGSNGSFDPSKKTYCFILNDSITVFTGNLQLLNINVDNKNVISYSITVYGDVIDLVKRLGDRLIVGNLKTLDDVENNRIRSTLDLDFDSLNHNRTSTLITNSWTQNTQSFGYYYPLIDYGFDFNAQDLSNTVTTTIPMNPLTVDKFYPAISSKYLFDKILSSVGYAYTSTLLNSDVFTETIIPYNGPLGSDISLTPDAINLLAFRAKDSSVPYVYYPLILNTGLTIPYYNIFDNVSIGNGFDNDFQYNTTTKRFKSKTNTSQSFNVNINSFITIPIASLSVIYTYARFYRSGFAGKICNSTTNPTPVFVPNLFFETNSSVNNPTNSQNIITTLTTGKLDSTMGPGMGAIQIGEEIWCEITFGLMTFVPSHTISMTITDASFYNVPYPDFLAEGFVEMNSFLPANIKQIDYIKSIITFFNLMVIPSKNNPAQLEFIPRDDYYLNGTQKDWSKKVDYTTQIEEILLSEQLNKQITFSYTPDTDYYNTAYTGKTNTTFGQYVEIIDNEWITGKQDIKVIFAPTPLDKVEGTNGVFLPKIMGTDSATNKPGGNTQCIIRFLRKNSTLMDSIIPSLPLATGDSISFFGGTAQTTYPYAGHLDHPVTPVVDYNFGSISYSFYKELTHLTPNNLINNYWIDYLSDLSDKNSRLIKCKIYLTPNDIAQFDYNDNIYIDGLTDDGGAYFYVNQITYTPTSNLPSIVTLIKTSRIRSYKKLINSSPPTFNLPAFNALILGPNKSNTTNTIVTGSNNRIGIGSFGSNILGGYNNVIAPNTPGVMIINSSNVTIDTPNVSVINNTLFYPNGTSTSLWNDIDSDEDTVLNPFSTAPYNDIDSAQDAVLGIGSTNPIQDFDSVEDNVI